MVLAGFLFVAYLYVSKLSIQNYVFATDNISLMKNYECFNSDPEDRDECLLNIQNAANKGHPLSKVILAIINKGESQDRTTLPEEKEFEEFLVTSRSFNRVLNYVPYSYYENDITIIENYSIQELVGVTRYLLSINRSLL